jgi:glycosyltransferase involved in cell wall biosynthesis
MNEGSGATARVCALIPAFDEAASITAVVSATKNYVEKVVVIDDGSQDDTAKLAADAGAHCLSNGANQGKGSAVRKGIAYISEEEYTHALFMDADGQHRPEDIPNLIRTANETMADMVIGTRRFQRERMPTSRYFSNTIGSMVASWLVGQEVQDSQCGFRLARMDKLRELRLEAKKYEVEMEILIKLSLAGGKLAFSPVSVVYEDGKAHSKMRPVRDTVRICFASLFYRFCRR